MKKKDVVVEVFRSIEEMNATPTTTNSKLTKAEIDRRNRVWMDFLKWLASHNPENNS